jgi:pimeloyl-ACP methyl ester carboxylesterase
MQPRMHHAVCLRAPAAYRMAYWQWGEPDNPKVLMCVHGLLRQGRDFDTLARRLAKHYRIICPDVLGRGQSDWLLDSKGYNIASYVADMAALLAALQATTVHWLGTSMGGLIGLALTAMAPTTVTRLILNDVGPVIEPSALQRIGGYIRLNERWSSFDEAAQILHERCTSFGVQSKTLWWDLCRPLLKQEHGLWRLRHDPHIADIFLQTTPEQIQHDQILLWNLYDAIACPTLLLRGAQSDLLSPATAVAMTQRGPKAVLREFVGVGHAPMLHNREQIDVIEAFLLAA